ncbi:MAG TPA: DUF4097 family beta strand repeat-containing protein [Bryobacteraceae bacterium]|nr:DUF4097 family beta strand repeat-containing protein [Bryobacteraceae bacterium]
MKSPARALMFLTAIAVPALAFQAQGSFERTIPAGGSVELDLRTDSGGIVVTQGSGGSVHVRAILKAHRGNGVPHDVESRIREIERNPPIEQNGNRIRIGHFPQPHALRGISMRLEVQTPARTKLVANADSGGIRVDGLAGPVECATDSGGIEISRIGGDVRAHADSGGIRIDDVQGSVFARADSGGIRAQRIAGPVDVSTDSGGIHVEQAKPGPIVARADSGGADLRLASNGGYDVNVSSESGTVSVRDLVARGSLSRHRAEGKLRGGGPLVDVRVDSGHISIE